MANKIKLHQRAITLLSCIEVWNERIADLEKSKKFYKHYIVTDMYSNCVEQSEAYGDYIVRAKEKYKNCINQIKLKIC